MFSWGNKHNLPQSNGHFGKRLAHTHAQKHRKYANISMAQLTSELYAINKAMFTAKHEHIRSESLKHTHMNSQQCSVVYPDFCVVCIDLYLLYYCIPDHRNACSSKPVPCYVQALLLCPLLLKISVE